MARCVLVTASDAQPHDYLADAANGLSYYYTFCRQSFGAGRKALFMIKPDPDEPDEVLMTGHDWDQPALWRRSMELLARDVMPAFRRHAAATPVRLT